MSVPTYRFGGTHQTISIFLFRFTVPDFYFLQISYLIVAVPTLLMLILPVI